jgi:DNA-binding transcriptional regulator YdaS (Cro superfamily)
VTSPPITYLSTAADPHGTSWAIDDPVVRLRYFGTPAAIDLGAARRWILGAGPDCNIRLSDPSRRISRRHAALERDGDAWTLTDLGSTNGVRQNREARRVFQLIPGDEIELGGVTLIAESARSIELHALLQRLIGWSPARLDDVDRALGAVREMASLRAALVVCGAGSLDGTLRRLHAATLGDRPLVVLRGPASGVAGLERATAGMLCIDAAAPPADLDLLIAGLRLPDARVRLVATAATAEAATALTARVQRIATVALPPLAHREPEIEPLIEAYGRDAAAELGAPAPGFRAQDPAWLRAAGLHTLAEIEAATRRLVALRNWGVAGGAKRLGVSHPALSRWARRRRVPT